MLRRHFIRNVSSAAASFQVLHGQEGAPKPDYIETMTPGPDVTIAVSHVGFRPEGQKKVVVRQDSARSFELRDIGSGPGFKIERPLLPVASDLGAAAVGDFSDLTRTGLYQIRVGKELSPPFFIRPDAWRRFLPTVVSYHKAQRCGAAVPNVHDICHLDDARRRDNNQHVDTAGGWHDAGDLRKWMDVTMLNGIGLLSLVRHLGAQWDLAGSGLAPLEEEIRWGNTYFLKMQDTDGRIWADVAGGKNGDNSDNHWTDNSAGTDDDRYLNTAKRPLTGAIFCTLQGAVAAHFKQTDAEYSKRCLDAAHKCWDATERGGETTELAWWVLAAVEMDRASGGSERGKQRIAERATALAALQDTESAAGGKLRGFWRMSAANEEPYKHAVHGGIPPFALLQAACAIPEHRQAKRWRHGVQLYVEGYALPMCSRTPYGVMPFGIYRGSPTPERYRTLEGDWTYRMFMPVRKQFWWLGLNAHLASHALLLAAAAREFQERSWRDLAFRQVEWIFGANPFGASLASGIGARNPYPHSRYAGVIPGGIMNGICGNVNDEPVLDTSFAGSWRTNEYWSPHVAYFEWAQAVLEA